MKPGRSPFERSQALVEATVVDGSIVLFVGRTSIFLDGTDAEAVIASLIRALARTGVARDFDDANENRN